MKILGISCYYHDAAAALIVDGKVVVAAEEERFTRIKHDSSFPSKAIEFCLNFSNTKIADIDYVVFYEKPFTKFERLTLTSFATVPLARGLFVSAYKTWLKDKLWIKYHLTNELKLDVNKILFCDHHLSHAAAAYFTSPFDKAAILTCDGVGEWTTTALGVGENEKVVLNKKIDFPHSLGLFYSTFTQYLGFQVNEGEFKVMGLAPYGKPIYKKKVEKLINQKADGSFTLDLTYFQFHKSDKVSYSKKFIKLFGVPPLAQDKSDVVQQVYADIASSAQAVLDDKILCIAKHLHDKTQMDNLCYGGGVALNGVSNWRILEKSGFKNLFIHPASGDSGGAIGAALYVYHHVLGNKRSLTETSMYLGQENTHSDIKNFVKGKKIKATHYSDNDLVKHVTNLLVDGKVVGWVRGRFEWGPRALGSRSILADPRSRKMRDLVNAKIKFREAFRPFAPVCLYEKGNEYFDLGKVSYQEPLEYMITVVPVKNRYRKSLGAITHVDGTARPQFIKREKNPVYYDLIKSFGRKTGVSVLLNTSFNLKGEPIVNTCEDAWNTFQKSGLDALVLGNYLLLK